MEINNDWNDFLKVEYEKDYYKELCKKIEEEYSNYEVYPQETEIYNAFKLTPLSKVKCVILGQDPYHNKGQAHGLCFSVQKGVAIPPSLANIYKEMHDDIGHDISTHGHLIKWAKEGVLMLNTVLTVRAHEPNSHKRIGWEKFSDAVIEILNKQDRPIVFILWGAPAAKKEKMLTNSKHLVLKAPHPSPLSAYRGFFGSKPFSKVNEFLEENNIAPIDWSID